MCIVRLFLHQPKVSLRVARPQDDFAKAAVQRLMSKRKKGEEDKEDKEDRQLELLTGDHPMILHVLWPFLLMWIWNWMKTSR